MDNSTTPWITAPWITEQIHVEARRIALKNIRNDTASGMMKY